MATGITKREQHSQDAISVSDFYREPTPLPPSNAEVTLSYPNKADRSDIIKPTGRRFMMMDGVSAEKANEIPENSFILDDNFLMS